MSDPINVALSGEHKSPAANKRTVFLEIAIGALRAHQDAWADFMGCRASTLERVQSHRRAFREALVALTFSCNYLESILYFHGRMRLGRNYDDSAVYESKLKALGIDDEELLAGVKQLRVARRELITGRQLELDGQEPSKLHIAQNEAEKAVALAMRICGLLEG